jgi:hypothetical protein
MKRKKILGLLLVISLAALSFSAMILADSEESSSKSLQEGEDSPGAHQCPRDGYDINEGPANRNGFGEEY